MLVTSSYIPSQPLSPSSGVNAIDDNPSNPKAEGAAGALAAYMHQNGVSTLEPNDLVKLATNANGETPPGVQDAAHYMLGHARIWQKIETNDVSTPDGVSGVANLDKAAQGEITLPARQALGTAMDAGVSAPAGETGQTAGTQDPSGVVEAYLEGAGEPHTMDADQLYRLATGSDVPADVQQAAGQLLAQPAAATSIPDGQASLAQLEQAAQGGIGANQPASPWASFPGGAPVAATGPGALMQGPPPAGPDPAQMAAVGTRDTSAPPAITASDPQSSMSALQQKDPVKFNAIMKDSQDGDGNKLVNDILDAYQSGDISKDQATSLVKNAQYTANQHGGGKINGAAKTRTKDVLGENDLIKGGVPKWVHSIASFLGPLGSVINGATNAADGSTADLVNAGKPAVQAGVSQAEQDLQALDPALAQELQAEIARKDGNGIAETMVKAKKEDASGAIFSDGDAASLASQDGVWGGGKTNAQADKDFTAAFGATVGDTLYNGLSGGEKFEKGLENFGTSIEGVVNQVIPFDKAGGVAGDAATGQWSAAGSQLLSGLETAGETALSAVSGGAGMVLKAGEMVARFATTAAKEGESALEQGLSYASKGNHLYGDVTSVTGTPGNNNSSQPAYS